MTVFHGSRSWDIFSLICFLLANSYIHVAGISSCYRCSKVPFGVLRSLGGSIGTGRRGFRGRVWARGSGGGGGV